MKQRIDRLERLAQQQSTQPPSAVEDLRVFEYRTGSAWLGRFDFDNVLESLAVVPEPTPAEDEVDRE